MGGDRGRGRAGESNLSSSTRFPRSPGAPYQVANGQHLPCRHGVALFVNGQPSKDTPGDLSLAERDRIIEMAWEDRTPFAAIEFQFGLTEPQVIALMRDELKASSFRLWRSRVSGRKTKHRALRGEDVLRFRSDQQRAISDNRR